MFDPMSRSTTFALQPQGIGPLDIALVDASIDREGKGERTHPWRWQRESSRFTHRLFKLCSIIFILLLLAFRIELVADRKF